MIALLVLALLQGAQALSGPQADAYVAQLLHGKREWRVEVRDHGDLTE